MRGVDDRHGHGDEGDRGKRVPDIEWEPDGDPPAPYDRKPADPTRQETLPGSEPGDALVGISLGTVPTPAAGEPIPASLPSSEGEETVYRPDDNPLIEEIAVRPWPTRYTFYERFRRDAVSLFSLKGEPCEKVPFFSYTPQYAQLSREQRAFYLWWRFRVREGQFPDVDYAYLLLFLYEIVNLPD